LGFHKSQEFRTNRPRQGISALTALTRFRSKVLLLLGLMILAGACEPGPADQGNQSANGPAPLRIISTAPSITEIVFALGAGERLAGVSKFCEYPAEARSIPSIGGLLDPSREAITRLDPDLVIVLKENLQFRNELAGDGYRVLTVDHKTIKGIVDSIETIGRACGRETEGKRIANGIRIRLAGYEEKMSTRRNPPRILISVSRNAGNGSLGRITIAGQDDYYDEMIRLAGGVNAYNGNIRYPAISTEGLLRMNPDLIIDLVPAYLEAKVDEAYLLAEWKEAKGARAWETGNVYIESGDFWTVPGPRFVKVIEELEKTLDQLTIDDFTVAGASSSSNEL